MLTLELAVVDVQQDRAPRSGRQLDDVETPVRRERDVDHRLVDEAAVTFALAQQGLPVRATGGAPDPERVQLASGTLASSLRYWRRERSTRTSQRETCIWLTPNSSAISRWLSSE
jgi:hypothetical protein